MKKKGLMKKINKVSLVGLPLENVVHVGERKQTMFGERCHVHLVYSCSCCYKLYLEGVEATCHMEVDRLVVGFLTQSEFTCL